MNKKRITAKKAREYKQRRSMTATHILIAVVALIECVLLIAITTYSWIESSSSLVIKNGPKSVVEQTNAQVDISKRPYYKVNLDTTKGVVNLHDEDQEIYFFSDVKYYELSKGTSPDGINMFFPRRNNTYTNSSEFRRGDTTDFNTSYYYFDFVIDNQTESGKDFFFANDVLFDLGNNQKDIFNATGGTLPPEYLTALRKAMRISVSSRVDTGAVETQIYSSVDASYSSIDKTAANPKDENLTSSVTSHSVAKYVYHEVDGINQAEKLFKASKGKQTKVSIRIWFDIMDPTFQEVFHFDQTTHSFDSEYFAKIPSADIGMKFALFCTDNDYEALYFDDYTFSNVADKEHLTDERSNYKMWFQAYQPATSKHTAGTPWLEMEVDSRRNGYKRWYTGTATTSMMSSDKNEYADGGMTSSHLSAAQFVYAPANAAGTAPDLNATGVYAWKLPGAPKTEDYFFNAYSYQPGASATGTYGNGVGLWQDDDTFTSMKLVTFDDKATAITTNSFNAPVYNGSGNETMSNLSFVKKKAIDDNYANTILYASNKDVADDFTADAATTVRLGTGSNTVDLWQRGGTLSVTTAAMHYDASDGVFKSYVPAFWLTGDYAKQNKGCCFTYTPNGSFSQNKASEVWYTAPSANADDEYVFTALGYTDSSFTDLGYVSDFRHNKDSYFTGVGTWGSVEPITLSTELIDTSVTASSRYFVGIPSGYSKLSGMSYYAMIPDATHTKFVAYVPEGIGDADHKMNFIRFSDYRDDSSHTGTVNARWYANTRYSFDTFYPVKTIASEDSSASTMYTRGYWNLSVLVDGSYENLIYDTLTDLDGMGTLGYSYDNETWETIITDGDSTASPPTSASLSNNIDAYRFYAPAEEPNHRTVYWRWTPYTDGSYTVENNGVTSTVEYESTVFNYTHDPATSDIYLLITEPRNGVSAN